MAAGFAGFEPVIGEVFALRTFRIGVGGTLLPLFDDTAWTEPTTARCRLTALGGPDHVAPDPDCRCGLYASATVDDAHEYPQARHVLAVVGVWGRTVVGTRGVRAQHGRVRSLWLSDAVPAELVAAVGARHPTVALYTDRDRMLADHPPTHVEGYARDRATDPGPVRRRVWSAAVAVAVVAGTLALWPARWALVAAVVGLVAAIVAAVDGGRSGSRAGRQRAAVTAAVTVWAAAGLVPLVPGLVLRVAVLEVALLGLGLAVRGRRLARTFPADAPSRSGRRA